jgi:2-amino-4-hydroxy-6-hydroxymethyldihydropteridine diphosphokinase
LSKLLHQAYLSLGSNENPKHYLKLAIEALKNTFGEVLLSPVYRTPAVGFEGPDFLNSAARIKTNMDVFVLDVWLHELEDSHDRRRDVPRYSSRTLDIDIIFFDDLIISGPGNLCIPRPELKHPFVLKPLADIAPDFRDPVSGKTLARSWAEHPNFKHGFIEEYIY